jgi:ribosomal-protein-alanine N-acetyltransferase
MKVALSRRKIEEAPTRRATKTIIAGARVVLRFPKRDDAGEWTRLRQASRTHLRPTEPRAPSGVDPFGASGFARMLAGASTERSIRLLICLRQSSEIVGQVSLTDISRGCFQSCYVGYWIGRPFAGQGLMSEALSLALRHAFVTLRLHRVEANIMPGNVPSRAVAARCGLRCEGLARRLLCLAGRWRDHERWAITIEDWRQLGKRVPRST